ARRKNRRPDEGILHARQRTGDFEYVGWRIGTNGPRNFRDRARETARWLHAVPIHRRSGIDSGHTPGVALLEHSLNPGADVLLGDGWNRFVERRRDYPGVQPCRPNLSGDFAAGSDRSK